MSFDRAALARAVAAHGRVARVVVAEVAGSTPREVGAAMLVWAGGQAGTIGGGTLEYEAARRALTGAGLSRHALGPDLGQCCGGRVTLLTEIFDAEAVAAVPEGGLFARGPGEMPLSVRRHLSEARGQGVIRAPQLIDGWMVEPVTRAQRPLWIWGAGHVGRAIVDVLHPLPDVAITWADTGPTRFPDAVPDAVTPLPASDLPRLAAHAPAEAAHLILTYSHEIDLALCHALLTRGFAFAGLIGSDTKWARFRKRLTALGHLDAEIGRICCPIGQKSLGKHPQAIALGVAAQLLQWENAREGALWDSRSSASGA
ncbi:XdhC and CoxI family protein [Roseivivax sp. THAF40]|uniref:xanthine dehydrogenase accessory protein XdhC n=1 Tax=unclassified Roseivivax TaxID=2639302 RepID=UPI001267D8BD|nr:MULTISPECIES: xanthine dehydrogenase accessory protein XdhC [unclassified Roseivivax]QFS84204.1 XdhC and CoxI family protein [Roseivivax sp. THAF197b]QFT48032.1 XdhC and CoxI family protein [Roseivivax sp. THAF40]